MGEGVATLHSRALCQVLTFSFYCGVFERQGDSGGDSSTITPRSLVRLMHTSDRAAPRNGEREKKRGRDPLHGIRYFSNEVLR